MKKDFLNHKKLNNLINYKIPKMIFNLKIKIIINKLTDNKCLNNNNYRNNKEIYLKPKLIFNST